MVTVTARSGAEHDHNAARRGVLVGDPEVSGQVACCALERRSRRTVLSTSESSTNRRPVNAGPSVMAMVFQRAESGLRVVSGSTVVVIAPHTDEERPVCRYCCSRAKRSHWSQAETSRFTKTQHLSAPADCGAGFRCRPDPAVQPKVSCQRRFTRPTNAIAVSPDAMRDDQAIAHGWRSSSDCVGTPTLRNSAVDTFW